MASRSILAALPPTMKPATGNVGRPAKAGERYPSGKLKTPTTSPTQIRRMLDLVRAQSRDHLLASAVGWLRCHEVIDDIDAAAAFAYAQLRGQYDQVMGTPPRSARSPSYQVGLGHSPGEETPDQAAYAIKTRKRYGEMLNSLDNAKQRELLDRVCIYDEHPTAWEMADLKAALDRIARHFKLTAKKAA